MNQSAARSLSDPESTLRCWRVERPRFYSSCKGGDRYVLAARLSASGETNELRRRFFIAHIVPMGYGGSWNDRDVLDLS
ncbi:hypothetical protein PF005_g33715 [Phytophthora fragariae]|uniref:Uncharacterized protein n=1 Tax=Phytophthora fragariae TaxID=53985 RepID=A0A6A3U336_9STRA|nr:hypothetical protein PF005_g33715 [Phytophthora fragariae]